MMARDFGWLQTASKSNAEKTLSVLELWDLQSHRE
jgi:hypothetical protein